MPVTSADSRLVDVDPAVPGMRDVLAPLDLVRRLAPTWGVSAAHVTYLRYKPGTSLVAGLRLTHDDGATSFAQALALGQGAPEKLAKVARAGEDDDVGRGAVVDGRLRVALADVTADRHLPGVRRVLRDGEGRVTPLVYKPGRRWVARRDVPGAPDELVRVHAPVALPGLLAGYRALSALPVTSLGSVRERRGVLTSPWVPGQSLDRLDGTGLWPRTGALLAAVHRQPTVAGLVPVDRAAQLTAAVDAVRAVAPLDVTAAAGATADRVLARLEGEGTRAVVHGDFSADQVIVRPDLAGTADSALSGQAEVTLIDLDRVGLDDPVADLASWYGTLVATGTEPGDPVDVLAPLLAGYTAAGGPADLTRLRLHCAAAVLQRAVEPFRRHLPHWPDEVARLVTVARELAG